MGELRQNHGGMIEWNGIDYYGNTFSPAKDASRFDTGGWNLGLLKGQLTATNWIKDELGTGWVADRIHALSQHTYAALQETDGVQVVTPREAVAGLIAFTVDGFDPPDLAERLSEDHNVTIRYVTKYINNPDAARVSVGFYNNEDDIERMINGIQQVQGASA